MKKERRKEWRIVITWKKKLKKKLAGLNEGGRKHYKSPH